ncbi:mitochondrial carrier [Epithele typhae]|uniref:mitochondrial carrier n=1 Tax=Epithele typhae TaxID=378194 RepID=UPI002008D386|nr:mitochondrial carrier [Epithele typhae]KAH9932124.1 mitochondrial carrier [Epithele typhae]
MATSASPVIKSSWLPPNSFHYLVGGGLGGMCGAIVTSPFDVVKTRLQSDLFRGRVASVTLEANGAGAVAIRRNVLWHFVETMDIVRDIYHVESPRALFKGLGPSLVSVVPARSICFFTYGNGKHIIADRFNNGVENSYVHLAAAAIAGLATGTATSPVWVVKTRLQLDTHPVASATAATSAPASRSLFGASMGMAKKILREEGFRGFYKGLSASYLGWTLYERLKRLTIGTQGRGGVQEWLGMIGSAGSAKCVATLITYPHEVIRTRLRQPLVNGRVKYTGLVQTLRLVIREEGVASLYGGLSAHLMRVIPNAAVMFFIYEAVLRMA